MPVRAAVAVILLTMALGTPARAQRLPVAGSLTNLPAGVGQIVGGVNGDLATTTRGLESEAGDLSAVRLDALRALVRANPQALELDAHGAAVVRGEVMALEPSPEAIERARTAGFSILRRTSIEPLGLEIVVLAPPAGVTAREGLRRLRKLDPGGRYDLDHIYSQSGESAAATSERSHDASPAKAKVAVGLLDTGVDAGHPVLAGEVAAQQGFAPGGVKVAAHGTAVASLIAGRGEGFQGAAPGARLYAADVYGSGPTGGSADAIIHALAWMAQQRVGVINISLVGPADLSVGAAVHAMIARGALIVAPVGNDGPAAPPLYPASYPGVVAVTAVDANDHPLPEAGHAAHVEFAAPGSGVLAAQPGGGFAKVRGTSFAAPIVAGRLAVLMRSDAPGEGGKAVAELAAIAKPVHGERWLGRGIVGYGFAQAAK